ncbi:hypothetical protein HN747_03915 [archaeon]|jgi:hypothetical protein|nr:hypothetical protein [archaeon]
MINKQCIGCGEKIKKKFDFCPWCGYSFKNRNEKQNFGMLGKNDSNTANPFGPELKLPFGMNKILNSLLKQVEGELQNINGGNGAPKGFKIKLSTGMPQMPQEEKAQAKQPQIIEEKVSKEEQKRRSKLPLEETSSTVKRLGDSIIYEIRAPGVKAKEDIAIINLEEGIQIKVYTKDKCYTKTIPLNIEISKISIKRDTLLVEMRA